MKKVKKIPLWKPLSDIPRPKGYTAKQWERQLAIENTRVTKAEVGAG
jgi:hypothetical protein